MPNKEHVDLIKQGVGIWNKWRKENLQIRPDLSKANLSKMHLEKADFHRMNLYGANLSLANLGRADLRGANLNHARLSGADLSRVILNETILSSTDLTNAKGLESCNHRGPSIIDHRTLIKSGHLPLEFLRGCGLPDNFIDYLPALLNEPLQFYSCFISYSSKDQEFAERLHADLQSNGVRCWYDRNDLRIGDRIRDTIDEAIRLRDKLLIVLSENSIGSEWVEDEVETALEEERNGEERRTILFPIMIDNTIQSTDRSWARKVKRTRHIGDFTNWKNHDVYKQAFNRLLRDLNMEAE